MSRNPQPIKGDNPSLSLDEFTTTIFDPDKIVESLDKNGFVIIKNVLNSEECKNVIDGAWKCLEKASVDFRTPIDRNNPETWSCIDELSTYKNIFKHYGFAHSDFMWDVRQNEKILKIFSLLYNQPTEKLLASFDGFSFQAPPEIINRGWFDKDYWFHVDQSYTRPEKEVYQSWVTARDVQPGDFTISFFVGSHKSFKDFGKRFDICNKKDFYKLRTKEQMAFYESRHNRIDVTCLAGSLVIWDSRLLHCNVRPRRERKEANFRTICFISYGPRLSGIKFKNLIKKRKDLFEKRSATGHWANSRVYASKHNDEKRRRKRIKCITDEPGEITLKSLVG